MIKQGQIYRLNSGTKAVVSFIEDVIEDIKLLYCLENNGYCFFIHSDKFIEKHTPELVAEFNTWKEAVASKEFIND